MDFLETVFFSAGVALDLTGVEFVEPLGLPRPLPEVGVAGVEGFALNDFDCSLKIVYSDAIICTCA